MVTFADVWTQFHERNHPLGWMLRNEGVANWIRFHSLPESKRYAETDEERAVILARQNAIATDVLEAGECWLVQTHWTTLPGEIDWADQHDPFWATREYGLEYAFEFLEEEYEDEDDPEREPDRPRRVYAALIDWTPGRFDRLLFSIADWKVSSTLWMGTDGAIFAPYDGGFDLFLPTPEAVERLRARYPEWLSDHPLGL